MSLTHDPPLPQGEHSPSTRVLFAAVQLAQQYDLPSRNWLRRFASQPTDELELRKLLHAFLGVAFLKVAYGRRPSDEDDWDPTAVLSRSIIAATTMVWPVRAAAQGDQSAAPSTESWELLAVVATAVYVQARAQGDTLGLAEFVTTLAEQVADL